MSPTVPGAAADGGAPLDVAFMVDAFPSVIATYILDQVAGLLERGHQVEVFARAPGVASQLHESVVEHRWADRTHYAGMATGRLQRLWGGLKILTGRRELWPRSLTLLPPWERRVEGRNLRYLYSLNWLPEPRRFDVIHAHFGPSANVAATLKRLGLLDGPIVATFHGYDMRRGVQNGPTEYEPIRTEGARFLCISNYNRRLLAEWGFAAEKFRTHHVGVQLERFPFRAARPADGVIRCISVSSLHPVKGLENSLDALRALIDRHPEQRFEYRLVGDGVLRQSLGAKVEALGLADHVRFLGYLGGDAVAAALADADLFWMPSLAEATPVALMEAQAVGLPAVATRVGAVDEVMLDGVSGVLVEPGGATAFLAGVEAILARRAEWPEMARAGRLHIESEYAAESLVDQLVEIYREVS